MKALVAVLLASTLSLAADGPDKAEKKDDKQVVDSAAQKRVPATAPTPWHAANELAVAEKVSGKQASLAATELLREAAELAQLRRQVAELQTLAQLNGQIANEQQLAADLKRHIEQAKDYARQEKMIGAATEQPSGAPRKVLVINYTTQYADIFVNGYYKLQVPRGKAAGSSLSTSGIPPCSR
jgi:hypothetical protein